MVDIITNDKRKVMKKRYIGLLAMIGIMALLTGCGKDKIKVKILDGYTTTTLNVKQGTTVNEALKQGEIWLSNQDTINPAGTDAIMKNMTVTVVHGGKFKVTDGTIEQEVEVKGQTVEAAITNAGIDITDKDYVNHDLKAIVINNMEIVVTHRIDVTLKVDGESKKIRTKATTVEELLEECHIHLDAKDRIIPSKSTVLKDGNKVMVERVNVKRVTVTEAIDFDTEYEYSNSMYEDQEKEKTPGIKGEKEVVYDITYVDGKEESRKQIKETIIKEPVSQVVTKGTLKRRRIISKERVEDCDGSGHGYYIITWSDGTVDYQDY